MINAIISFVGSLLILGIMLYVLIDAETVRTVKLTKRAKKAYHKYGNNKLESEVNKIEEKLNK